MFAVRGVPYGWETGVLGVERCRRVRPAASNTLLWSPIPARRAAWLGLTRSIGWSLVGQGQVGTGGPGGSYRPGVTLARLPGGYLRILPH